MGLEGVVSPGISSKTGCFSLAAAELPSNAASATASRLIPANRPHPVGDEGSPMAGQGAALSPGALRLILLAPSFNSALLRLCGLLDRMLCCLLFMMIFASGSGLNQRALARLGKSSIRVPVCDSNLDPNPTASRRWPKDKLQDRQRGRGRKGGRRRGDSFGTIVMAGELRHQWLLLMEWVTPGAFGTPGGRVNQHSGAKSPHPRCG